MRTDTRGVGEIPDSSTSGKPVNAGDVVLDRHTSYVFLSYPNRATGHVTGDTSQDNQLRPLPSSRVPARTPSEGKMDAHHLEKAMETVESIEEANAFDTQLDLTALSGRLLELWESAVQSSCHHQDILAVLERAVKAAAIDGKATRKQLAAFREALTYLRQEHLGHETARIVRRRLREAGFGALSFTGE